MKSEVLVGIVTLNRKEKLLHTLQECHNMGFCHIVVLDNGSTDGTRDYLRSQTELAHLFTETNVGGSGGFNLIMRYFIEKTVCQFLLIMDDDAYPTFTCHDLLAFLNTKESLPSPAYAFRVTYPDGTLCEMNRPGVNILNHFPTWKLRNNFHIDESSKEKFVDFAGFVGLLLRRETIASIGLVSKYFFIYSDDTYYTLSISRQLGKILYSPKFVFVHDCNRSSRNLAHHDPMRLQRDIINKIVLVREYSSFKIIYLFLYLIRLLFINPKISFQIFKAFTRGLTVDKSLYRNEAI